MYKVFKTSDTSSQEDSVKQPNVLISPPKRTKSISSSSSSSYSSMSLANTTTTTTSSEEDIVDKTKRRSSSSGHKKTLKTQVSSLVLSNLTSKTHKNSNSGTSPRSPHSPSSLSSNECSPKTSGRDKADNSDSYRSITENDHYNDGILNKLNKDKFNIDFCFICDETTPLHLLIKEIVITGIKCNKPIYREINMCINCKNNIKVNTTKSEYIIDNKLDNIEIVHITTKARLCYYECIDPSYIKL